MTETRPEIPEGLEKDHAIAKREPNEPWNGEFVAEIIERIARSETRVTLLEDALREVSDALVAYHFQPVARILRARGIIDAALEGKG